MQVAFRTDASARIGNGHVVRCMSLAMALRRAGARCTFIGADLPDSVRQWINQEGFDTLVHRGTLQVVDTSAPWRLDVARDAESSVAAMRAGSARPDWLVVDHYGIDARWEELVRNEVGKILAIDDLADRRHDVDVLLDQNLQESSDRYSGLVPSRCKRLLGPRYALLRPAFAAARSAQESGSSPRRGILACVGGSDPNDILSKMVSAWSRTSEPRRPLHLAVGRGSPNASRLERQCAAMPGLTLHMPATDMAALMAGSELLLGTTGGISWERCCVGLPALMGTTADNQKPNLHQLCRLRTGLSVGNWNDVDIDQLAMTLDALLRHPTLLARMGARAARLVDGRGADRVACVLLRQHTSLRRAEDGDADMAWFWRNAESTRLNSNDPAPVPHTDHIAWWARTRADRQRDLLIAMIGELPVGVLRFDHAEGGATVSIYLDPALTGLGLGRYVLCAGQRWAAQHRGGLKRMIAWILPQNSASIGSFEAAGFTRAERGKWVWDGTGLK